MTADRRRFSLALALLAVTAVALYVPGQAREVPLAASLHSIPAHLAGWSVAADPPPDLASFDPAAGEQATLAFRRDSEVVWVSVFYYPLQTEGSRGRGRELVLPARGWADLAERTVQIPAADGLSPLSAHLVSIRVHDQPVTILYWYQVRGHGVASAYRYRALLLYNRLAHQRADGALVRLVWPSPKSFDAPGPDQPHVAFVQAIHAELLRVLPR